jgi:hypothetical protein
MPRFVIDLGDVEMSKSDEMALGADLQKTALGYLAGIKFQEPFVVRFPWDWLGLIARRDFDSLKISEQVLIKSLDSLPGR